jgi:hypothetical protein
VDGNFGVDEEVMNYTGLGPALPLLRFVGFQPQCSNFIFALQFTMDIEM